MPFVGHITRTRVLLSLLSSLADFQILELMEGGDLRNALSGPDRDRYQWYAHGQELAMDIVRGLAYLHENRVIHGECTSAEPVLPCNALLFSTQQLLGDLVARWTIKCVQWHHSKGRHIMQAT